MRRITLALALMGAVAATGCGKTSTSTNGGNRGVAEGTFKVTIQNGQDGNVSLAITKGYVVSTPAGIDCGVAPHSACSFEFPVEDAAGNPVVVTLAATATTGNNFYGFAGDCSGDACSLSGAADKYVVARFDPGTGHDNWNPELNSALHSSQAQALLANVPLSYKWQCGDCHGASLTGAGLAPSCANCHAGSATRPTPVDPLAPDAVASGETCTDCHANQGAVHQATYTKYTNTALVATIESTVSTDNGNGTFKTVVTFNLKKSGAAYGDATLSGLDQKRYMGLRFDSANNEFDTADALSFGTLKSLGSGRYTVEIAAAAYDITAVNGFVYFYFAEKPTLIPAKGNYRIYDNVASVAAKFGTWTFTSAANSADCSRCHGTPYLKHGYRAGNVAGLDDMVPCKACHTDQRTGGHQAWQLLAEDPLAYATQEGTPTAAQNAMYAYTASTMNDTHMSHAMEFAFPQTMANCVTCHSGKLNAILTDALFTAKTCRSCHPVETAGDANRAPALRSVMPADHTWNLYSDASPAAPACNGCHAAGGTAPVFSAIHTGYNSIIYANNAGLKYSDAYTAAITAASYDSATNVISATVTVTENTAVSGFTVDSVKPAVYFAPYGYDTKDFIIAYKSQTTDTTTPATGFTSSCSVASPVKTCTVTMDLDTVSGGATWKSRIADGSVKRIEIAVLPTLKDAAGVTLAQNAVTRTFSLTGNAFADGFYPAIADAAKCNKCHEALATTFHSGNRGGSVVACRICHQVTSGGSHLPEQSRSIDSYVHAIHSFQPFDPADINFADPVAALRYEHHIESTYPYFTTLACESCHVAATPTAVPYNPPTEAKSLPGILSASEAGIPNTALSVVTGPAARACGGCHRAELIVNHDGAGLDAFIGHTAAFGYREGVSASFPTTTDVLNDIIDRLYCDNTEDCVAP